MKRTSRYLQDRCCEGGSRFRTESVEELGHHMAERWSTWCYQQDRPWKSPAAGFRPHQDTEYRHRPRTSPPWYRPVGSPQCRSSRAKQWRPLGRCRAETASPEDASSARSAEPSGHQSDQRNRAGRRSDQGWPSGGSGPVRLWHWELHPCRRRWQLGLLVRSHRWWVDGDSLQLGLELIRRPQHRGDLQNAEFEGVGNSLDDRNASLGAN